MCYYKDKINITKMDTSNAGQHWFSTEDELLLEELNKNIDIKTIAQNHKRTAINTRRRLIAYKMHLEKISIEEIMYTTKFDQKTIREIIDKRDKFKSKSIENDISEMKNDISEMKNTLKKLVKYLLVLHNES